LWAPEAEDALARFLAPGIDRDLLAASARQIDQCLLDAPGEFGESRYDAVRIGFAFPLGVHFEVLDDVRTVIVHDVWRIDQ
jgi:hypothetical protein